MPIRDHTPIDVSIVVVSFNVRAFLASLLRSVREASHRLSVEVFVVDNRSSDDSGGMVRREFPETQLIENATNKGFAVAGNRALRLFRGRYVCLINPDTLLREDTLQVMTEFMDAHPDVGAAGCKVLNPDGSLQLACRRSIPTLSSAFFKMSGLSRLFPNNRKIGAYNLTYLDPDAVHDVDAVSGSFLFVRRTTIEQVGLMDEAFFMYGEDLDWQYRMRQAGWRVCYVPFTRIVHYKGESAKHHRVRSLLEFYRAMYVFAKKHRKTSDMRFMTLSFHAVIAIGVVLKGGLSFLKAGVGKTMLPLADLAVVNITPLLATFFRIGRIPPVNDDTIGAYLAVHTTYSLVWMSCFMLAGLYGEQKYSGRTALTAVTAGFVVIAAATYFFPTYHFSRAVLLMAWGMNMALIAGWRIAAARLIAAPRRALIVGTDAAAHALHNCLTVSERRPYEVVGFLDSALKSADATMLGLRVLDGNGNIAETLDIHRIDEVMVASPSVSYEDILHLVSSCARLGVGLTLIANREAFLAGKTDRVETVSLVDPGGNPVAIGQRMIRRAVRGLLTERHFTTGARR
ncbi:MAG: glycosyltransferase [candidate division Zixibacteria bacterium]|nr:glycosyltransferase [candidate division Zixibacteria bacterium]